MEGVDPASSGIESYPFRYPTQAQSQLHPDNLYCTAYLRGFAPVAVERARVLEIGCGNGRNLIPVACDLPEGECTGIDLAGEAIADAVSVAAEIGLSNVRFVHADLRDAIEELGEFDYIIAHGFYSWVPNEVRAAFWRLTQRCLSPHGLLLLSFNVLPGWHDRSALRELALYHTEGTPDAESRLQKAWEAIAWFAEKGDPGHSLIADARRVQKKGLELSAYDELFPAMSPFFFHDVAELAARNGLRYAGDAKDRYREGLHQNPQIRNWVESEAGNDEIRREQYLDFLSMRPFRQSVFTRNGHPRETVPVSERVCDLWVTSDFRASEPDGTGSRMLYCESTGHRVEARDPLVAGLFDALAAAAPENVHLGGLLQSIAPRLSVAGGDGNDELRRVLEEVPETGLLACYSRHIAVPRTVPERPRVGALTRLEAARGMGLTNRFHRVFPSPDPLLRGAITLLNGERDVSEIASVLRDAILEQHRRGTPEAQLPEASLPLLRSPVFSARPELASSAEGVHSVLLRLLPVGLEQLRRGALLLP